MRDSNNADKIPVIDRKITCRRWSVIALQAVFLIFGLVYTAYSANSWLSSIDGRWDYDQLMKWSTGLDWTVIMKESMTVGVSLNFTSLIAILCGLLLVK